ncbi:hypothetical protein [Zobellia alginiliquefaciens]|uniref:hypothetical protein n=1 Tax=Zobellia alginiliquefaciens TaxID=3032586 RepID=UPI0023E44119|nr:hypothetical protein [Zobellia alginiliquefaciens]
MSLRLEPILTEGIAQVSYFVCDDSTGGSAVIDPRPDTDIYLQKAQHYGNWHMVYLFSLSFIYFYSISLQGCF